MMMHGLFRSSKPKFESDLLRIYIEPYYLLYSSVNETAEYVPPGRSWHSFTFISPNRAVLYGGFSTYNNVLSKYVDFPLHSMFTFLPRID